MTIVYNRSKQTPRRRLLRQAETEAERLLWQRVKNNQLGVKFRRQYGIGYYIADFCAPQQKLVIELDGGIHDDVERKEYDNWRTKAIEEFGFKVMRFKNEEVMENTRDVLERIKGELDLTPSLPLLRGGFGRGRERGAQSNMV